MVDGQSRSENASHKGRNETSSLQTLWPKLLYPAGNNLSLLDNMPPVTLGEELCKNVYNLYTIYMGRIYAKVKKVNAC